MYFLSLAITRDRYKQFLKDHYRQPLPDDDKLLTTASKQYIQLAIISKKDTTRKQADEFTKKSLHGLTDEILCEKAPIELKYILMPRDDGTPVHCVLVEGQPGIGKSTLAWELCHKWDELESVRHYELVVLICLREKRAQEARCLEELLPCDATTNIKELIGAIGRGKGVLIVCDGFDELPFKQRQKGSIYIELIKGRLLPEATIVVTSRPSVSADLWSLCQHNIHRHLEVIGFTKADIKKFAKSVFSGDILVEFLSYVTSNPPLHGMMYIPLNAVIVALIYQHSYDTGTPYPKTMTQLFDALTRALIRRHLVSTRQVPSEYCMPPSLQCIEDIRKLPPLVAEELLDLVELAYNRVCRRTYVFTDLGKDFKHLSMLKKTTTLNVSAGPECSYSFLHLTLQEYLAALAIVFKNFLIEFSLGRYVFQFLAGIYSNDDYHSQPVYKKLIALLAERRSSDGLWLVQCAYECPSIMDSDVLKMNSELQDHPRFFEFDKINVVPELGFNWYATGYCISHFNRGWKLTAEGDYLNDDTIDLFLKGLRSSLEPKGKIRSLKSSTSLSQIIPPLREFYQLYRLHLHRVNVDQDDEDVLRQLILAPESELRKVKYSVSQTTKYTDTLIPLLFQQSSLQELILTDLANEPSHIPEDIKTMNLPHSNTNLHSLSIRRTGFLRPLAAFIPNISSLTNLDLSYQLYSDLPIITNIVRTHRTLKMLSMMKNSEGYYADALTDSYSKLIELFDAVCNSRIMFLINDRKLPPHIQQRYKRRYPFLP